MLYTTSSTTTCGMHNRWTVAEHAGQSDNSNKQLSSQIKLLYSTLSTLAIACNYIQSFIWNCESHN